MNYKDKTLMTVLVLFVLFGWLAVENITPPIEEISTGQYVNDIWVEHPVSNVEVFTLVDDTVDHRVFKCKVSVSCRKMAEAIVYEARSESLQGRYAVANVILNRVESKRFPNTVEGVVSQRKQFSYLQDMHKQSTPSEKDWTDGYQIAYDSIMGKVARITKADHYLNPDVVRKMPRWTKVYNRVMVIGNHHFYTSN